MIVNLIILVLACALSFVAGMVFALVPAGALTMWAVARWLKQYGIEIVGGEVSVQQNCGNGCHFTTEYGFVPEAGCMVHDPSGVPQPAWEGHVEAMSLN